MYRDDRVLIGIWNGLLAGALWGFVFLAPQLLPGFRPTQLSAARYLIYGGLSFLLLLPRWKAVLSQIGKREWFGLIWLSLMGNIAYYILLSCAIQTAGGAATSLIVGMLPVAVTLIGTREKGAATLSNLILPLLLCCTGIGLISYHAFDPSTGGPETAHKTIGLLCAFGALISWTAYAVGNSRYLVRLPSISAHDWSLLTGLVTGALAITLGIFIFPLEAARHDSAEWLRFWAVNASMAIVASILGNMFWNRASRLLPLTLTGQMIVSETLFALLYTFLWQHRWPSLLETFAILCLVSGVCWCVSQHRSQKVESKISISETVAS